MDNASGYKCVICYDSICCDSTKYQSINLTCGHAFGKSCMRKWIESSNQKECILCKNPLTDYEINEIKNIPLQERAVIIAQKAIKIFCRNISNDFSLLNVVPAALVVAEITAGPFFGDHSWIPVMAATMSFTFSCMAVGGAAAAVGNAAGVDRAVVTAVGAAAGSVCTAAVTAGCILFNAEAVGVFAGGGVEVCAADVGDVGVAVGAIGVTAGALGVITGALGVIAGAVRDSTGAIGAVITAGAFGAALVAAEAYGAAGAIPVTAGFAVSAVGAAWFILGAHLGAIGAMRVNAEQELNPVIV